MRKELPAKVRIKIRSVTNFGPDVILINEGLYVRRRRKDTKNRRLSSPKMLLDPKVIRLSRYFIKPNDV